MAEKGFTRRSAVLSGIATGLGLSWPISKAKGARPPWAGGPKKTRYGVAKFSTVIGTMARPRVFGETPFVSPLGFLSNRAPGYFPPTHIDEYGVISSEGPAPAGFKGVNLVYRSGITCNNGYTNISEATCLANGWQMHDSLGNNLTNLGFGGVLADPANTSYQAAWWSATHSYAQSVGADGFWIDDTTPKVIDFYGTSEYPAEHPSQALYKEALISFAQYVRNQCLANGYVLPGYNTGISQDDNASLMTSWFADIGPYAGYLTPEYWMIAVDGGNPGSVRKTGSAAWYQHWDAHRALHGVCKTAGCKLLPLPSQYGQSYILGSFLLDWENSGACMWAPDDTYITQTDPWISFYAQARALGLPTAAATNSGAVWTRQFQNGQLQVDSANATATIT